MNQESALAKAMMLDILSGAVQMKHKKMTPRRKKVNFPKSFMIGCCISFKRTRGHDSYCLNNAFVYIEILNNFLFTSTENSFSYDEVIFQDHNASYHGAKEIKAFLEENHIKLITYQWTVRI